MTLIFSIGCRLPTQSGARAERANIETARAVNTKTRYTGQIEKEISPRHILDSGARVPDRG